MKEYLLKQAKVRTYKVVINKLTPQTVLEWTGKHKPTWQDLDPYSSLEDVGDTGNDTASSVMDENVPPHPPHYKLRARSSKKRNSTRPVRMTTQSVSYTDMFQSKNEELPFKKPKKRVSQTLSGPSEARMRAKHKPTVHPKVTHPIVKPALKVEMQHTPKPPSSDAETIVYETPKAQESSEDDNIPLSIVKDKINKNKNDKPTDTTASTSKKHVFVSKTVGLIKGKRHRTVKCSKCDKCTQSLAELNTHYRANHARVKCKYCNLLFNMPSSLARHQYFHEIATKRCRCGKVFRFDSELKTHKLRHR